MSKGISPEARFSRLAQAVESRASSTGTQFIAMTNSYDSFRVLAWVGPDQKFAGLSYAGYRGHPWMQKSPLPRRMAQYSVTGSVGVNGEEVHHGQSWLYKRIVRDEETIIDFVENPQSIPALPRKVYPHSSRGHMPDAKQLINRVTQIIENGRLDADASGIDIYTSPSLT